MIPTNKYNTSITDELLGGLDITSQTEFHDSINKILLLQNLIHPNRKYTKDLDRWDNPNLPLQSEVLEGEPYRKLDSKGRIRVDFSNPHILTNMEYFRPTARYFEEFGCYTKFFENPDPDSDYRKFWDEERRRCIEGYTRDSDGEWIPGYLYHYWNYGRVKVKIKTGAKTAKEIEAFPRIYDSHYWWFHYIERAETLGVFGFNLKKRRWGYSYVLSNMMSRNYTHLKLSKSFIMASQKEFLYRDGPMPKFKMNQAFIEKYTPFGSPRLVDTTEHTKSGYKDPKLGVEMGRFSEVMGVTCKDDPDKGRGKCFAPGTEILMADGSIKLIENIVEGDLVMGIDSLPRKVLKTHRGIDKMYKVTPMNGNIQVVNSNHDIYTNYYDYKRNIQYSKLIKPEEYINLPKNVKTRYNLTKVGIDFKEQELLLDPYFLGIWLAKTEITTIDNEIVDAVYEFANKENVTCKEYTKKGTNIRQLMLSRGGESGYHNIETNKIKNKLNQLNLLNNKHIPDIYLKNSKDNRLKLLAGLLDTDGYYDKKYQRFEIVQVNKVLAYNIVYLCRSLGFKTSINIRKIKGYEKDYYRITIFNNLDIIPTKLKRKQPDKYNKQQLNSLDTKFKVEYLEEGEYYGFTVNKDNLFLLGDFTISHNSGKLVAFEEVGVFPGLEKTWTVAEESVKQGDLTYGFLCGGGTGGSEGADFTSAERMFYHPRAYNILELQNVYSKTNGTGECSFFVPSYISYEECFDDNGNSDVVKALIRILKEREKIRVTTHDSNRLLQKKAEIPITPEEAVLRKEGSIFPILDIKEYLSSIYPLQDRFTAPHYIGELTLEADGSSKFNINTGKVPIRHYPTKPDIDKLGAIEIYEHPSKVNKDKFRYIIGIDPIENDEVLYSVSLGSCFVFDRFTRRIVAEYTGRPSSANDFFEICYRLAIYYNATIMYENNKKGLYGYFQMAKRALHLLADFPQHLADKQELKPRVLVGNTSKGFTSNPEVKRYGKRLQADWMMEQAFSDLSDLELDDEGNPKEITQLNLHKIRSIGYLEEASQWNPDGNFDRVDAMTAVMIYDAELGKVETGVYKEKVKTLADDPFFSRNYKGSKFSSSDRMIKGWSI